MQNKKLLAYLGIFAAVFLLLFLSLRQGAEPVAAPARLVSVPATPATTSDTVLRKASVGIKKSQEISHIKLRAGEAAYTAALVTPESVLMVMQQLSSSTTFRFTAKEYPSLGLFVESINGRKNSGGLYWFLYINGTSSLSGVSTAIIKPGDLIEWRYE